jgi:hypothetical protein
MNKKDNMMNNSKKKLRAVSLKDISYNNNLASKFSKVILLNRVVQAFSLPPLRTGSPQIEVLFKEHHLLRKNHKRI